MKNISFLLLFLVILSCTDKGKNKSTLQKETDSIPVEPTENELNMDESLVTQIEELAKTPKIAKALDLIKDYDKETIKNQIDLTEIEAPPFKEDKFGKPEHFIKLLKKYGIDSVKIDSVGNVIAHRKGTEGKKVIAIAGHLDTVFPEGTDVTVTKSNDTLYAPGIGDDNRGLTAILTLVRALNETEIHTKNDLLFIADVGEEGLGDLRGMKHLFRNNGPQIDELISVEPGSINRITNGALGSHRYKVTFKGPGGHSWGSFGLANPAHAMGKAISVFVQKADDYTKDGLKTSYNIGEIGGGTSVNSVPYENWMKVDMRSLSQNRLKKIDSLFQRSIKEGLNHQNGIRRKGDSLTVKVEMIGERPSGFTDVEEALVQKAAATSVFVGGKPKLGTSSTDSNVPISTGIPAVTLGGGGKSGKAHSLDEWYYNKDGYKGIQRLLMVLATQAEVVQEN